MELGEEDERSIAHLLIEQVEFADVILLNKVDLVSKEDIHTLHGIIRSLNRNANIIETSRSDVGLNKILHTNLFDFERASEASGWLKVMRGEENSEIDEYGISSISFEARKPFHPQRLYDFLHLEFEGLYRAKGYFWLSSQPDFMAEMSFAGTVREYHPSGFWWVSTPKDEWPEDEESLEEIKGCWHPRFGDREQKLIFIGKAEILNDIHRALEESLLTDEELEKGFEYSQDLPDPFGNWNEYLQN
jgi:G3E family GTPase